MVEEAEWRVADLEDPSNAKEARYAAVCPAWAGAAPAAVVGVRHAMIHEMTIPLLVLSVHYAGAEECLEA